MNRRGSFFPAACAALALFAAACTKNTTTPVTPSPGCSYSVVQPTTAFGPEGGTGSVPVTATAGCAWTAVSSATFVTIATGASGSGNGTAAFSVAANSGSARTATLTIAGTTTTITQAAASTTPAATLSAPSAKSPIAGASVDPGRPALVVNNATSTGSIGTVTYHFDVSDLPTFPNDATRTFTVDGIAQGSGTTSWTVNRDLGANVLWYWRARATNGTVTGAFSDVETFRTGPACAFALSATSASVAAAGAASNTVTVTTTSTCSWAAVSNSSFITVSSGASGTGSGSVTFAVAANTGAARSGALSIAGQTVTVNQFAAAPIGIVASFDLFDPATQAASTTECRLRSPISASTTCTLRANAVAVAPAVIANYAWTLVYTYGPQVNTVTQSGTDPNMALTDTCGKEQATPDGVLQPLFVTLTVTDSAGATVTLRSGSGTQPALNLRLFTCGS